MLRCTAIADTDASLWSNQGRLMGLPTGVVAVDGAVEEAEVEEEVEVEEMKTEAEVGDTRRYIR